MSYFTQNASLFLINYSITQDSLPFYRFFRFPARDKKEEAETLLPPEFGLLFPGFPGGILLCPEYAFGNGKGQDQNRKPADRFHGQTDFRGDAASGYIIMNDYNGNAGKALYAVDAGISLFAHGRPLVF